MSDEIITEEKESQQRRSPWGKIGMLISTLALLIFICAFAYGYFQLAKINVSLAHLITDLEKKLASSQQDVTALQKSVADLQQAAQKSQELSTQQEQMIAEWRAVEKGDVDKWRVAEAQYLVKLANDHVQFTHNLTMALVLLQRADQILQSLQDPNLLEIRKSLAAEIANLQAAPQIDITNLYLRLTALNSQLDQLPLPINPLKNESTIQAYPAITPGTSWWKAGLERSWQTLRKIVIVRYNGTNALPLVLPDEKIFLYQNLHAQLENAMWGVLHRNAEVYQASLARAVAWIQQHFVQDASETKAMLENLQALRKVNIQPPAANLSATLALFDKYVAQGSASSADTTVSGNR